MTATLIGSDIDTDISDEVDLAPPPPMCDGLLEYPEPRTPCTNVAEYKTHVTCCGTVFLFCEDCMFAIAKEVKYLEPGGHACISCDRKIMDPENHLIFDGRL